MTTKKSGKGKPTTKRSKATDLKARDADTKKVKGGLLTNTSFRVNTLTFSSNATGKG
jgi:hypothetical protein